MHAKFLVALLFMFFLTTVPGTATAAPPDRIRSVHGHGVWVLDTGDAYDNHQPYIESTTIDAQLDADGSARGTIVWMDTFNGPFDDHGELYSGYTWQVAVDTFLVLSENEVYVEGTIFHSNVEQDIGNRSGFYVYDGGPGEPDGIYFSPAGPEYVYPVLKGNFVID